MAVVNILVLIHGITVDPQPRTHQGDYGTLMQGIFNLQPGLRQVFARTVGVEWGHRPPNTDPGDLRPDQRIMDAENTLHLRVGQEAVAADHSPENHLLGPLVDIPAVLVNKMTGPIKENLGVYGFTDLLYYVSAEGEAHVRAAVYRQVLQALEEFRGAEEVRLHLIGHSLGVTLCHDFLFGLFAPTDQLTGGAPGFLSNPIASAADIEAYRFWRDKASTSVLKVGSFTSAASQLPFMMMRKQALVDTLAQGRSLDPSVIGIPAAGGVKWRIFYDLIDVLGFPTRRLYDTTTSIEEFQVDNGANPALVHSQYWANAVVMQQTADLLRRNVG